MASKDTGNEDPKDASFSIGDRVVLHGLVKMKRLNGSHGFIASDLDEVTGRHQVYLDLIDQLPAATVKPTNIQLEPPATAIFERAHVENGILEESQGRAFSCILDVIRYLVAYSLHDDPEIRYFDDIEPLKDTNMEKLQFLTATAWSYWEDPGAHKRTGGRGIYECLVSFLPEMFGVEDGNIDHLSEPEKRPIRALQDPVAVAGWNHRIHGNFWVVGKDPQDGGTLLVLDKNKGAVYKVFGMTSCLYDLVSRAIPGGKPVLAKLTMVPWYGRLVYDGVVSPINPRPSKQLTQKLQDAVQLAQAQERVVDRLRQLELHDAATAERKEAADDNDESEQEATKEERLIISSLIPITPYPKWKQEDGNDPGAWVFRRMGYTEDDNPNHAGIILSAGQPIGHFECSALAPVSTDILKWLVQYSLQRSQRPTNINIDDKACYRRVKFLLKDVDDIIVQYYPPPTQEELAAISMMERAGKKPF